VFSGDLRYVGDESGRLSVAGRNKFIVLFMVFLFSITAVAVGAPGAGGVKLNFEVLPSGKVKLTWVVESVGKYRFDLYREEFGKEEIKLNEKPIDPVTDPDKSSTRGFYIDDNAVRGNRYRYRLVVLNESGNELFSTEKKELTVHDGHPPSMVGNLKAETSEDSITLTWDKLEDPEVIGYRVYRRRYSISTMREKKFTGGKWELVAELLPQITRFVDENVRDMELYSYVVRAFDEYSGEGDPSFPVFAALPDKVPPEPPQNVSGLIEEDGKVVISWEKSSSPDVTQYYVYRRIEKGSYGVLARVPATDEEKYTFIDHLNPSSAYVYSYLVLASDMAGNKSKPTAEVVLELPDRLPPARPVITSMDVEKEKIVVRWASSGDADLAGYNVYRSEMSGEKEGKKTKLNEELLKSNRFEDEEVRGGKVYRYYVTAVDDSGNESRFSSGRTARTLMNVSAAMPENLSLEELEGGKIRLSWSPVESDELRGYFVYRGMSRDGVFVKVSGLVKSEVYEERVEGEYGELWYRVRAFYRGGKLSEFSEPVFLKKQGGGK